MNSADKTVRVANNDPLSGKVINNYRLLERLGAGGMGLVYRAEQISIKRPVAVKLLPVRLSQDEVNVKRVQREATAMGNLRHPNIATLFEFGFSDDGQPYLVMELISGTSLRQLIHKQGILPPDRACRILAQVADAMDYAHKNGIIHRDLKPDNIMLDCEHTEDFVKILDFGIAKSSADVISLTQAGQVVGSPLYMSPEQCMGLMLTGKTDIYSLGAILYECLTGEAPYRGSTSYDTVRKKTSEQPPPFPSAFKHLQELENLTLSCLAMKTTGRPESMAVVKEQLEQFAKHSYPDVKWQKTAAQTTDSSGEQASIPANSTPSTPRPVSKKQTKLWQDFENTDNLERISGETLVQIDDRGSEAHLDVRPGRGAGTAPDTVPHTQSEGERTNTRTEPDAAFSAKSGRTSVNALIEPAALWSAFNKNKTIILLSLTVGFTLMAGLALGLIYSMSPGDDNRALSTEASIHSTDTRPSAAAKEAAPADINDGTSSTSRSATDNTPVRSPAQGKRSEPAHNYRPQKTTHRTTKYKIRAEGAVKRFFRRIEKLRF